MVRQIILILLCLAVNLATATDKIYVHDSSTIYLVDVDDKATTLIARPNLDGELTDIATDLSGNLYILTFYSLYRLDPTSQTLDLIGSHGVSGANALVFDGDANLYAASGIDQNLYRLNLTTGEGVYIGALASPSAGDLAYVNGRLFLAGSDDRLSVVNIQGNDEPSTVGNFGLATSVFGLAVGESNTIYGGSYSKILRVDPISGGVSYLMDMPSSGSIYGMAPYTAVTLREEDRLFNFAEEAYPDLFSPMFSTSSQFGEYYYRFYKNTSSILAVSDNQVIYYVVGVSPVVAGSFRDFLPEEISSRFLSFPLSASLYPDGAYTAASVSSVLDHSLGAPYSFDGVVTAFTGETGSGVAIDAGCYPKVGGGSFDVAGIYKGTIAGSCLPDQGLNYDGHPGYDYIAVSGTPVLAAAAGTVVSINNTKTGLPGRCVPRGIDTDGCDAWGFLGIDVGDGFIVQYGHLSEISVEAGEYVSEGQVIGKTGNSAPSRFSISPHLHFEVLKYSASHPYEYTFVDPYGWDGVVSGDPLTEVTGIRNIRLWK